MAITNTIQASPAACARWDSIVANAGANVRVQLYEVKPDGGFTFGVKVGQRGHWREFAVNPDGGRAYPLDY